MHLLLESHDTRTTPLGVVVSLGVHVVLAFVVITAYREGLDEAKAPDEFAMFLVPPNRMIYVAGDGPALVRGDDSDGKTSNQKGHGGSGEEGGSGAFSPSTGDTATSTKLTISLPNILGDSVLTEIEVDSAVKRYEWSAAPDYPISLLQKNIEGGAFVIYVVDTLGMADTASMKVVNATHEEFVQAVREAMPKMRFRPAILGGYKVRQLVQQNFSFKIQRPDSVLPRLVKTPPPA
ncbi:MAG TPA: energy transducer TonB [Gemmatimonadales bacterium]|nr:energy transducer TonB [Gemmatimonadales bacterium]